MSALRGQDQATAQDTEKSGLQNTQNTCLNLNSFSKEKFIESFIKVLLQDTMHAKVTII